MRYSIKPCLLLWVLLSFCKLSNGQVIISQYYEGTGTNKWIELTNLGNTTVNTASPQLKLALWAQSGSSGNINITGLPSQVVNLNIIIPAQGSVLIGNPANGSEVPYLTSASAAQTSSLVMNFNGNDGIALLDASDNIIDQFGHGINATDISYYRNLSITNPSATFSTTEWTVATIAAVQNATTGNPQRLGYHLNNTCQPPAAAPTSPAYYTVSSTAIGGAFANVTSDEFLVLFSTSSSLSALPQNGIVYNNGDVIGNATVINRSANNIFYATGLQSSTTYYFFIFALNNNCIGGPAYLTSQYLSTSNSTTANPLPQASNIYFGNLHSHSSYSDGNIDNPTKTPADNYAFAKESMCMDFLGISEHNHTGAGMSLSNWQPGLNQAAASTTASFLAMYGMEFGVISDGGHAVIYGMDSLMGWEANQHQLFVDRGNFRNPGGLFERINQHGNRSFVTLAHPEPNDFNAIFNSAYDAAADNAVVGIALETGPANSTSVAYNNPGSVMAFLDYYKIMLSKGYHTGPTIDHDNHNMTFGRTARTRLAVVAPTLTEPALLQSMRNRSFYATQDCNARIRYSIGTDQMGSIVVAVGAPQLSISCETMSAVSSVKIMAGTPGSGLFPTELANFNTPNISYTDNSLAVSAQRYYYLDITEADGSRIITAPIWYTRISGIVAIPSLATFTAINQPNSVLLKWTTLQQTGPGNFVIERSTDDGRTFNGIGTVQSNQSASSSSNYSITDNNPFNGLAYYRLRYNQPNTASQYSPQRVIDRSETPATSIGVYPNPVNDFATVQITSAQTSDGVLELFDVSARKVLTKKLLVTTGQQQVVLPMQHMPAGTYVLRFSFGGGQKNLMIQKR